MDEERTVICKSCGKKTTVFKEAKNEYCPECKLLHIIDFIEHPIQLSFPSISRERLVEVINETMPCNCIPAYKDRQLSAPDCPNCNYAESIAYAILPLLNKEGILVKWIDVKDDLPEVGVNVLTWNGIGGMHVCYRGYFKDKTDINWKFALDGEPSYYLNITHWAKVTPPKP